MDFYKKDLRQHLVKFIYILSVRNVTMNKGCFHLGICSDGAAHRCWRNIRLSRVLILAASQSSVVEHGLRDGEFVFWGV